MIEDRQSLINKFQKIMDTNMSPQIIAAECANITEKYADRLRVNDVSDSTRTLSIKFAQALLMDFEMSTKGDGQTLCWKLCGTSNCLTTEETFDRFIEEITSNDS